ncbi:MAG TPA: hypothetical protein VMU19_09465 [Bryobacteraceae bacterium]|nr:hypothetical protein [Bryobacteraceae bacterium]
MHDLATDEVLGFPPYVLFRCSSDRQHVIGTSKSPGGDLYAGVPPQGKIAGAGSFGAADFNISWDGSNVVYYGDAQLCVSSSTGAAQCIEPQGSELLDSPSVSNSAEVLVAKGAGKECHYKNTYNFGPQRAPGSSGETVDECVGIAYWKPGLSAIQLIEPLGRSPQWISPMTADLLRKWGARQPANATKGGAGSAFTAMSQAVRFSQTPGYGAGVQSAINALSGELNCLQENYANLL